MVREKNQQMTNPCKFCNAPNWNPTHKGTLLDKLFNSCGEKGHVAFIDSLILLWESEIIIKTIFSTHETAQKDLFNKRVIAKTREQKHDSIKVDVYMDYN